MPKVKIRENSWWARMAARKLKAGSVALVLGNTIHLYKVSAADFKNSPRWLRHELKHIEQVRRLGIVRFLILYLWESIRKGYHHNKFEVEARAAEQDEFLVDRYEIGERLS